MQESLFRMPLTPKLHHASRSIEFPQGGFLLNPSYRHEEMIEFLLILEGEALFDLDGRSFVAKAHSLVFYRPGVLHDQQCNPGMAFKAFYIRGCNFHELISPFECLLRRHGAPVIELGEHFLRLAGRLQEIIDEWNGFDPVSQDMAQLSFALFLLDLARIISPNISPPKTGPAALRSAAAAKRYIEEHYSEPITLNMLCHIAYTNANDLCRVFAEEVGFSPIQYVIHYRVAAAKDYLRSTSMPVKEIASLVGYDSETHFIKVFKKISGMTPGKYRRIMK